MERVGRFEGSEKWEKVQPFMKFFLDVGREIRLVLKIYADSRKNLKIYADSCKNLMIYADSCKNLKIYADSCKEEPGRSISYIR